MYFVTHAIDPYVASGTCMLLFGFLVMSVRNRRNASRFRTISSLGLLAFLVGAGVEGATRWIAYVTKPVGN